MFGFVKQSTYDEMHSKYVSKVLQFESIALWFHRNGGFDHIEKCIKESKTKSNQFTLEEVKSMISLCHPDKHDGKDSATRVTQKLLQMKKELEK